MDWSAIAGVVVGGTITGGVQVVLEARRQRGQADRDAEAYDRAEASRKAEARAIAQLLDEECQHDQSMLIRALTKGKWWLPYELLERRVPYEDRKKLWERLSTDDSVVIGKAQGWIDYLISRRAALADSPPDLTQEDDDRLETIYTMLEEARRALCRVPGARVFSPHDRAAIAADVARDAAST